MHPQTDIYNMNQAREFLSEYDNILIFAGAGLSQELGIPTYWTGDNPKYGAHKSEYGYTALEHSTAPLWSINLEAQINYFHGLNQMILAKQEKNLKTSSYSKLLNFLTQNNKSYFCITSNVDSAFLNAGFNENQIFEVHGQYRWSQCLITPEHKLVKTNPDVKNTPCIECGTQTRPNALFFHDWHYNPELSNVQWDNYVDFRENMSPRTLILEIGVGSTVPRIKGMAYQTYVEENIPYVHINPESYDFGERTNRVGQPNAPTIWVKGTTVEAFKKLHIK